MTVPPKTVAFARRVLQVVVFPILLNAISLPDGGMSATDHTPKANRSVKVLDFVQLGGFIMAIGRIAIGKWLSGLRAS